MNMGLVVPLQTNPNTLVSNSIEGVDVIFSAIIAGVILYFANKSFLGNVPAYLTILAGFLVTVYLGQYGITKTLGFALLTEGIYKLIQEYIHINVSS